jgi:hypothetical protein
MPISDEKAMEILNRKLPKSYDELSLLGKAWRRLSGAFTFPPQPLTEEEKKAREDAAIKRTIRRVYNSDPCPPR